MPTEPTLSRRLARLMLARAAAGLPAPVMARARLHALDNIGIALAAGPSLDICREVLEGLAFGGTSGGSRVWGQALRLPPPQAAFANAALAHALDYDDIHDVARLHPTTVSLPSALSVAEAAGASVPVVLTALALGNELMCRLGRAAAPTGEGPGSDWFLTQLFGYLGGALAAGLVLGLDEARMTSAFGLAYMQMAGGKQAGFGTGANARSIYPAFAAMGGVQAALLARAGVIGPEGALDGAAGMFRLYLGGAPSPATLEVLLDEAAWDWLDTEVKPWPSCRLSHPYVNAALALREQLAGEPVEGEIVVSVNASAAKLCRPIEERRVPDTLQDAKYSIPFMTAFALAHGRVDLENLGQDAPRDAAALALAQRVRIEERLPDKPGHPPAEISVQTVDGPLVVRRDAAPVLDATGVQAKARDCLRHAGLGAGAAQATQRLVTALRQESLTLLLEAIPEVG